MAIIDVIKFNGIANRDWLVYRYPGDSFVYGSQLIVGEGQMAVFVKGGRALDFFSPGTYTLRSQNIPLLQSFINLPFGGRTPFSAEVFFINNTAKLDVLWGTSDPISLIDPKYGVRIRVRAFGQMGMRITNFRVFLTELIGAVGDAQVVKYDTVMGHFKGVTVTKVKTMIADLIINQKISVMEIAPKLEELSEKVHESLAGEFERFGIEMIDFNLSSINFPDEDFETINMLLGERAAFDIMGDSRYNAKRSFDVMEAAAGNEIGGGMAAAGMSFGFGAGSGLMSSSFSQTFANSSVYSTSCQACGHMNEPGDKFCGNCGGKLSKEQIECYSCHMLIDEDAKFCSNCGSSMLSKPCPGCQKVNKPGTKFCAECGTKLGG
ncbi:hypothetical protein GCM10023310_23950 [Paenibacillus vulneris]|uniref:SPFH domain-containing protein n=1 Tax=Paenibacillus vulneris TaxID=1133364 RepID=A0ABW3UXK3_9BACL